jgi:methyl-accepting chemotaxis protein
MSVICNLPTSRKFAYAFGVICSLCILLGTYTLINFMDISKKRMEVSETSFPNGLDGMIRQFRLDEDRQPGGNS